METWNYRNEILFEHRFWLQILGDHSRFILMALAEEEKETIQRAKHFIHLFDKLLDQSKMKLDEEELANLNNSAYNAACEIRAFKLHIIKELLVGNIKINLPPTFINHMVNEVEEYIFILSCLVNKELSLLNPIHYHKLWLLDGSGHAASISSSLDMSEKDLIKLSMKYRKKFDTLYEKATEMKGYMRTGLNKFPALDKLNQDADEEMLCFKKFLKKLEKLVIEKKVLGTLRPLILDHMYREECYYLTKLSMVSEVKRPECDPTKPRIDC
ncbi:DUF2935 domain-containing protein [Clostridium sardiniense]|uniref:DUF2935 domain-containing protein n=1 Tax=Clostridium sardiniense TaxID=29369 RepID=A0ABS7KZJ6_CLOSR|nr:DUF2935 domain-containing protein [Clostridium sardiniense]MBY0755942.1 DUF2935 domain-containing protein [Clostridium sardiniense]